MVFGKAAFVAPPSPGVAPRAPRPFPSPSSRPPLGRCPAAPVPAPSARGGPDASRRLVAAVDGETAAAPLLPLFAYKVAATVRGQRLQWYLDASIALALVAFLTTLAK